MTLAKTAVMVTLVAREWWRQHRSRRQQRELGHQPVVVVDGGGNGMEPIGVDKGCWKDIIAAAAINRYYS